MNACFPSIKSVFRGVKRRFRGEDLVMQLNVCIFVAILKDEVTYVVRGLRPIASYILYGSLTTPHYTIYYSVIH